MTTDQQTQSTGPRAAKGLATLALLKAHFDSGNDHIEMFVPFVLDAISAHSSGDFGLEEIRDLVEKRHGLRIPAQPLRTILARTAKRGVRREGGRYFREAAFPKAADLTAARAATEAEHRRLGAAFMEFGEANGLPIATEQDALALLLEFLSRNHVSLILESDPGLESPNLPRSVDGGLSGREQRVVALFVTNAASRVPHLADALQRMLEGFVLQNALLLKDIDSAKRRFSKLTVFFDTGFLLEALGMKGEAAGLAAREGLDLLRDTGAELPYSKRQSWKSGESFVCTRIAWLRPKESNPSIGRT